MTMLAFSLLVLVHLCWAKIKLPSDQAPKHFCTAFDLTGNYTRSFSNEQTRISPAVVCSSGKTTATGSKTCSVTAQGFWTTPARYNFTHNGVSESEREGLGEVSEAEYEFDWTMYTVFDNTDLYNSHPAFGVLMPQTISMNDTIAASDASAGVGFYAAAVNQYRCLSGVLHGCPAGAASQNWTHVEACAPIFTSQTYLGLPVYAAQVSIVLTNASEAASLTSNPHARPPSGLSAGMGSSIGVSCIWVWMSSLIVIAVLVL